MTRNPNHYRPQLSTHTGIYGAPMGRAEYRPSDLTATVKLHVTRVYINRGGYDRGGHYWGLGAPLYMAEGYAQEGTDQEEAVRLFIRATDRPAALEAIKTQLKNATFYRNR